MITRSAAALAVTAVIVGALLPITGTAAVPDPEHGAFIALAALGGVAVLVATAGAPDRLSAARHARLRAAALWLGCSLVLLMTLAAVAMHAQTLQLRRLVEAQLNTSLYVVQQPLAATLYVLALVLAADAGALSSVLGPSSRARAAVEGVLLLALSGIGATLFLGGFAGPWLPAPAWLVSKAVFVAGVVAMTRRALSRLPAEGRVGMAWALAVAASLNLVVTVGLVT